MAIDYVKPKVILHRKLFIQFKQWCCGDVKRDFGHLCKFRGDFPRPLF